MKSPVALIERVFLCGHMVGMIFIRKSIPSSTMSFVSMIFNHSITEFWISYESVMDSLEILFLAAFLQWVSRKVFLVSQLLTISMSMRSPLSFYCAQEQKGDPSCSGRISSSPLFLFARSPRTCSRRCRRPSIDKHTVHCVLGSVSRNSHSMNHLF